MASFSNSNVLSKLKERHSNPSTLPVINRSRRLSFDSNHQEYTLERILNGQKKTRTKDLIHVYIIRDLIYISKDKSHQTDRQQLRWVATMLASTLNRMWSCLLKWGLHVPGCMCLFHVQSVGLAEGSRETRVEWKENGTPIRPTYETASISRRWTYAYCMTQQFYS